MAKIQVGMTERKPLKPLRKGSLFQYRKPTASLLGAPPAEMTMPAKLQNCQHTACSVPLVEKEPSPAYDKRDEVGLGSVINVHDDL